MENSATLYTARLTIRLITESDWQAVKNIRADAATSPYAQYDHALPATDDAARAWTAKWAAGNNPSQMLFAVCLKSAMIGYVVFFQTDGGYEVGFCFHSAHHRKGYAKESISALLAHLHRQGIYKFTAGTALNNLPSVKLLEALHFRQVGTEKVSFYKDESGNDIVFDGGQYELLLPRTTCTGKAATGPATPGQ